MDEMEEYRNGIEHRRGDRRLKNDRRKVETPKFFDAIFIIDMLIFAFMGIGLYFANKN